ncbi:MAG: hypothetical protein ACO1SX_07100 [Actinomycetota bacterium]
MDRRELLLRAIRGAAPLVALGTLLTGESAEAGKKKKKKGPGMETICTNIQVGGDYKGGDKVPNGALVVVSMVRRDNGRRVVAFLNKKTKIYRQGARIRFRDLRDMLYATPEGVAEGYIDVPVNVYFTATQLARRIDFDP